MTVVSHSEQFLYHRMFLLHHQKYSKQFSAHAEVISLAHLSDVDVHQFSFLALCSANVVSLIGALINLMTKHNMANNTVDD